MTIQAKPISIDRNWEKLHGKVYVEFDDETCVCLFANGGAPADSGHDWVDEDITREEQNAYYAAAAAYCGLSGKEAAPRVWTRDDVLFSLRQMARDATAGSRQDWQAPTDAQLGYLAGLLLADAQRRNATGNPVDSIRGTVLTRRMASTWIEQLSNAAG